uniref:Uncharacterized protein n=1 Tax=Arundo donax TaxID=35708 RepID=A0A0A8YJC8_ARUDO
MSNKIQDPLNHVKKQHNFNTKNHKQVTQHTILKGLHTQSNKVNIIIDDIQNMVFMTSCHFFL